MLQNFKKINNTKLLQAFDLDQKALKEPDAKKKPYYLKNHLRYTKTY